ncbi:sugar phosphate isomerase/epimerase [Leeia sp. TBRC 13508]|uniref:Sugar phosphate isomerase/epimerase n=1 Tax=Leeia speluncae TaxID=2884804 RepID=A0ABS8D958_9NEIS|nr:sugar phosphate isomerase/epimerase [Leeia speluncae]MCB6184558.1 sugar phosphate isomerase/epimerase [Leeia speluncae]
MSTNQALLVFQSMWAMENLLPGGKSASHEERLTQIAAAGFAGFTDHYYNRQHVARLAETFKPLGLQAEGQVFPTNIEELIPALENGTEFGCHHITIQADFRPRTLKEAIRVIEGWQRLAEQVAFPVLIETHRYRVTNDLLFTLDLLAEMPNLKLLSDLSHYVVAREFPLPPAEADDQQIKTILDHGWGFHGRVSNGHQVQIPVSFAQHQPWVDVFKAWWTYGMSSWQKRAKADDTLTFTCELGPTPYAITGSDGLDITDRWKEALMLREWAQACWQDALQTIET